MHSICSGTQACTEESNPRSDRDILPCGIPGHRTELDSQAGCGPVLSGRDESVAMVFGRERSSGPAGGPHLYVLMPPAINSAD